MDEAAMATPAGSALVIETNRGLGDLGNKEWTNIMNLNREHMMIEEKMGLTQSPPNQAETIPLEVSDGGCCRE
jgi:hypothetical protein